MKPDDQKLVLIYIELDVAVNKPPEEHSMFRKNLDGWIGYGVQFERLFDRCKEGFVKVGSGVFLADENACHPAILDVIATCRKDRIDCLIVPIADYPITLGTLNPVLTRAVSALTKNFRLSQFPPQEPQNKP